MKDTKKEFKYFTIAEWEKEQDYLRKKHSEGWRFVKLGGFGVYHFEKCQPEDVIYQLDYNPEGIEHKSEYVRMFNDCGWEYLQDYAGYSYFRKPASEANGDEEIFCDDQSRADMISRVFKGRVVPLIIIFFAIILPNLFQQSYLGNPVLTGVFTALLVLYIVLLVGFGLKFFEYWKALRK